MRLKNPKRKQTQMGRLGRLCIEYELKDFKDNAVGSFGVKRYEFYGDLLHQS